MFGEIHGLPVHALAVHATVVLVPLASLLGVLFAIPRTHAWARLPLLLVSLGSVVSVFVSRESGKKLQETLQLQGRTAELIDEHRHRANQLFVFVIVFAVLVVVAYALTRVTNVNRVVTGTISVLLVVGAIGVAYQTYRVGDIGAKAVWNPTGQIDYSGGG